MWPDIFFIFIEGTFIYPRFLLSFAKDEESVDNNFIHIVLFLGGWNEGFIQEPSTTLFIPKSFVFSWK